MIKMQSGEFVVPSTGLKGWHLAEQPPSGGSIRTSTYSIRYGSSFPEGTTPNIVLGITYLDTQNNGNGGINTRISVTKAAIDNNQFSLVFKTWSHSMVWGITVSWMAYADVES